MMGSDALSSSQCSFPLSSPTFVPVAQLAEHRAVMREVVRSAPAGQSLRVLK